MKQVLRSFMLLFALLVIWGDKIYAQTTEFGSGSSCTVEGTNVTFFVHKAGDLALWSNQSIGNNKNIIIKTADGIVLNDDDLASLTTKLTYGNSEYYFDLSQASVPEGTKLSEKFNGMQTSYILPLNSKEVASDFTGSKYYVMYTDGSKTEVVVKNGGISKATSVSYMQSSKEIVLDGDTEEKNIDFSEFANLDVLDICALTLQVSDATVKVPESITTIKVPQGFDKSKISPDAVLDKVQEVIPKEDPYTKSGNALTVNIEEGVSLLEILNQANMSYVSNLTIKTVGDRKLTTDDVATINDLKFKYTKEIDNNTLWQDATLNLEGCTIEDYDILKSLKNNASTEGEESYAGIRNVILPSGLDKTIVNAEHFVGLTNMNAAISVSADQSAIVGYVAIAGGLSTTMYQYPTFRPNIYQYIGNNATSSEDGVSSASKLKSVVLSGSLLPCDISAGSNSQKILDENGHLCYEISKDGKTLTETGTKGFATDMDSKTTLALNGTQLTDIDLADATFSNELDMNFSVLGHSRLVNVKLPTSKKMTTIPGQCFNNIKSLVSICIPSNYEKIGRGAFLLSAVQHIYTTLAEGDEEGTKVDFGDNTFTLSSNLKEIGTAAFQTTKETITDIYVLAKEAPKCEKDAFSEGSYFGWGGFKGNLVHPINRDNYVNQSGKIRFTMLHYPYRLNKEEAAKYTDITKVYTLQDETLATDGNGNTLIWPNMSEFYRSYYQACLGYVWEDWREDRELNDPNNKNAIFQGYKEAQYFKDGDIVTNPTQYDMAYAGWHQFVLTDAYDVVDPDTPHHDYSGISDNNWWTLCVSFDMTKKDVRDFFGYGEQETEDKMPIVTTLTGVVRNQTEKSITLRFDKDFYKEAVSDDDVVIKAGHPYMIKPYMTQADIDACMTPAGHVYKNKTITASNDFVAGSNLADDKFAVSVIAKDENDDDIEGYAYKMIGGFVQKDVPQHGYFLGWEGNYPAGHVTYFRNADGSQHNWNQFTCLIGHNLQATLGENASGSYLMTVSCADDSFKDGTVNLAKVHLAFGSDDNTTGIIKVNGQVVNSSNVDKIYNINGQYVGNSLDNLPKGLFIVNGKKYVVK